MNVSMSLKARVNNLNFISMHFQDIDIKVEKKKENGRLSY